MEGIGYILIIIAYALVAAWDIIIAVDAYKEGSKFKSILFTAAAIYFIAQLVKLSIQNSLT